MLLKLVRPLELRLKRSKGNSKICLCDHGLRAGWLQEVIPLDAEGLRQSSHLTDLAGHIAGSATGYFLGGFPHLDLAHFPERGPEPEVDFILTVGENRIPLEVKYRQHIDPHRDTVGLRAFIEKRVYNAPFALLVTLLDDVSIPEPRIIPVSLPSLLLLRGAKIPITDVWIGACCMNVGGILLTRDKHFALIDPIDTLILEG